MSCNFNDFIHSNLWLVTPARFAWVMSDLSEMCLDFRCHFNRIGTAEHKWRHFDSSSEGYRRNMYIFLSMRVCLKSSKLGKIILLNWQTHVISFISILQSELFLPLSLNFFQPLPVIWSYNFQFCLIVHNYILISSP